MAEAVYAICAFTSLICAGLLFRGFLKSHSRLLLWTALAFSFYALNCIFLFVDMALFPEVDANGPFWRNMLGAFSGGLLLFGLIWEVS